MHRSSRFVIGIDLGTTNSTLSYIDTASGEEIKTLAIPQLVEAGEIKSLPALPSFLYLPGEYEWPPASTATLINFLYSSKKFVCQTGRKLQVATCLLRLRPVRYRLPASAHKRARI